MLNLNKYASKFNRNNSGSERLDEENVITTDESVVEFVTENSLYDAIPEPVPANKVLPNWYKNLEGKLDKGLNNSTVKRCAPFMEALTAGWIIPLAAEVEVNIDENEMELNWNFNREVIGKHDIEQVGGKNFPVEKPIIKFHNYWAIKVPKGYSVLFTQPLNRIEQRFKVFSGVVDCDRYFNYINFPSLWLDMDIDTVVLEAGTPIIQAIPFKRDAMITDARSKPFSDEEAVAFEREKTRLASIESNYRNETWVPKDGTRMLVDE